MRFLFLFLVLAFFAAYCSARTPWPRSVYARAKTIANQLTKDEKIQLVHGNLKTYLSINEKYTGIVDSIDRLRIPPLHLQDGPQGVGKGYFSTTHGATQWPSALAVTSTWDVKLFEKFGQAMAAEHSAKGSNILLGPMVNLARVPRGGRNYESVGEDPVIASAYAWNIIKGIQEGEHPMMAVIKHGFYNSQEDDRKEVSEVVPLRAARELYFPPFLTAVDAGVGSMMCSYNRINGTYACENPDTMNWFKKSEEEGGAGFDGFIMSDWYATHTVWEAANAGLDQEMPLGLYFSAGLHLANTIGKVSDARLTDMAERIIRAMIATNIFDKYPTGKLDTDSRTEANTLLAQQLSASSIVLLKNDNILPLNPQDFLNRNNGSSILVLGDETTTGASGSGAVLAPYKITPYMGIAERLLKTPGASPRPVQCKTFSNTDFYQQGNEKVDANNVEDCCAKCSARLDCNYFTFQWPNSCWIKFNNTGRRGGLFLTSGECTPPPVSVSYLTGVDIPAAVTAARKASHVVIAVATTQGEGGDRKNLSLLDDQNALIDAVAAVNNNIIVVVRVGGAVLLPWANKVKAILWQGMGGQEAGRGLASILFGDFNPAARLPLSFPASETDSWITSPEQYPGVKAEGKSFPEAVYSEELLIGYRWYDKKNLSPAYPFGHGLSYTTFSYTGLTVTGSVTATSSVSIRLSITNTGAYHGEEVVQFYISYPESAGEPPKVLRKFQKIFLAKGESVTVTESLSVKDVQIFDVRPNKFVQVKGDFKLLVGASSRDIRASADFTSA